MTHSYQHQACLVHLVLCSSGVSELVSAYWRLLKYIWQLHPTIEEYYFTGNWYSNNTMILSSHTFISVPITVRLVILILDRYLHILIERSIWKSYNKLYIPQFSLFLNNESRYQNSIKNSYPYNLTLSSVLLSEVIFHVFTLLSTSTWFTKACKSHQLT